MFVFKTRYSLVISHPIVLRGRLPSPIWSEICISYRSFPFLLLNKLLSLVQPNIKAFPPHEVDVVLVQPFFCYPVMFSSAIYPALFRTALHNNSHKAPKPIRTEPLLGIFMVWKAL